MATLSPVSPTASRRPHAVLPTRRSSTPRFHSLDTTATSCSPPTRSPGNSPTRVVIPISKLPLWLIATTLPLARTTGRVELGGAGGEAPASVWQVARAAAPRSDPSWRQSRTDDAGVLAVASIPEDQSRRSDDERLRGELKPLLVSQRGARRRRIAARRCDGFSTRSSRLPLTLPARSRLRRA